MSNPGRTVVAGVDGSKPALAAARYAAGMAARSRAALHLIDGYLHPLGFGAAGLSTYGPFILRSAAECRVWTRNLSIELAISTQLDGFRVCLVPELRRWSAHCGPEA